MDIKMTRVFLKINELFPTIQPPGEVWNLLYRDITPILNTRESARFSCIPWSFSRLTFL
jgi:hypothetical protein